MSELKTWIMQNNTEKKETRQPQTLTVVCASEQLLTYHLARGSLLQVPFVTMHLHMQNSDSYQRVSVATDP